METEPSDDPDICWSRDDEIHGEGLDEAVRVRVALLWRRTTRAQLAEQLGVSLSTVGDYMSGRRKLAGATGRVSLGAIARVLNVDPETLRRGGGCPCCG